MTGRVSPPHNKGPGLAPKGGGPVLDVRGLTISARLGQGEAVLVDDLSFTLKRGETLCIAGESGSGKSLTSLAIMGLLPQPGVGITRGEIRFGDKDLTRLSESAMRRIRGDRIAMIFQEPMTSLNPVLSIGRQLIEALQTHTSLATAKARAEAVAALQAVRIPEPERRLKQYPHELSGGMRQRVMIAMALALRPDILIADEPTTALDVTVQGEILELLRDLQREFGTSVILITHDMGVVAEMADRVIVMQKGRIVETGDVQAVFERPQEAYTQALLAAVPRIGAGAQAAHPETQEQHSTVARLDGVSVRFDIRGGLFGRPTHQVRAVENVSFDIRAGETFSLVGESGCGKSTIAKALVGLVPFSGDINLAGDPVGLRDPRLQSRIRRNAQMIFQDPYASLDPRMKVGELVAEPLVIHRIGSAAERRERVDWLFGRVGLEPGHVDRYPHEFSGGQRQRICIARALALQPKLIIADESVSALDVSVQARVLALLKELQAEFGIAYLFISHDMAVVENISDRVAVMYLGQIVELGTREQIFMNPRHTYTKRLIEAVPVPDPQRRRHHFPRLDKEIASPVFPVNADRAAVTLSDIGRGHLVAAEMA